MDQPSGVIHEEWLFFIFTDKVDGIEVVLMPWEAVLIEAVAIILIACGESFIWIFDTCITVGATSRYREVKADI